jgi:hypothetical protein
MNGQATHHERRHIGKTENDLCIPKSRYVGQPVARLIPVPHPAATCQELAERCEQWPNLPPEEAEAFARDSEDLGRTQFDLDFATEGARRFPEG